MQSSTLSGKKILLFEDQPAVITTVTALLGKHNSTLEAFRTPFKLNQSDLQAYDAIILDIRFSNESEMGPLDSKNGIEHLKYLRSQTQTIPIIMHSVDNNTVTINEAFQFGATAFVPKYSCNHSLIAILKAAINGDQKALESSKKSHNHEEQSHSSSRRIDAILGQEPYLSLINMISAGSSIREIAAKKRCTPREVVVRVELLKNILRRSASSEMIEEVEKFIRDNEDAFLSRR
ncbi:response regulator [Reinekea sp. G2M2-21]|uniref:response regulator n=1 Tax=Reinekea sp. G2M2-21 TaxID=2788942 RepID=UPI0018AACCEA|nr:response regulator [Reinekea sp. G2M2-21]